MVIRLSKYPVHIGSDALVELERFISHSDYSAVFVLADKNTRRFCYPLVKDFLPEHRLIVINPGELKKTIEECRGIWVELAADVADRNSLLINVGGGVVTDMGGFAAGLYKRGIDFVHVPTTLLAQTDACIGGKAGVDFFSLKNLIGMFVSPAAVFIYPAFLKTLPKRELFSGFAEVIKHCLIADKIGFEKLPLKKKLPATFEKLITRSVKIKSKITEADPFESGARNALNFGHTIGHAIESTYLEDGIGVLLHGEAIAAGMICETFLSKRKNLLDDASADLIISYLVKIYDLPVFDEERMERIYNYVINDKKNRNKKILCTFLQGIGKYKINCAINREEVFLSLRYYNSAIH